MCDCGDICPDPVELYAEGTVVCRACGVVTRDVVFERDAWSDHHGPPANPIPINRAIDKIARTLRLVETHRVIETAKLMYAEVERRRALRETNGRMSKQCFAVACVYLAFKVGDCPRSLRDFGDSTDVGAAVKAVQGLLADTPYGPKIRESVAADDLLLRCAAAISGAAGLTTSQKCALSSRAHEIARLVADTGCLEGRTPEAVAAGVLFVASRDVGLTFNKKVVHEACGVSCVTMNKAAAEIAILKRNDH